MILPPKQMLWTPLLHWAPLLIGCDTITVIAEAKGCLIYSWVNSHLDALKSSSSSTTSSLSYPSSSQFVERAMGCLVYNRGHMLPSLSYPPASQFTRATCIQFPPRWFDHRTVQDLFMWVLTKKGWFPYIIIYIQVNRNTKAIGGWTGFFVQFRNWASQ